MSTNNDNGFMLEVQVVRGANGGVDIKATLANAERAAKAYAAEDVQANNAVIETATKIINDDRYKHVQNMTAGTLARMVVVAIGEVPTDKLCAEAEVRVEEFLSAQPDKFLHIPRGRNSGFHFVDRYTKEELAKLQKSKSAEEATTK